MFGNIGSSELVIISVILLVFFGNRKMKVIARGLGKSTKEIKKLQNEVQKTLQGVADDIDDKKPDETSSETALNPETEESDPEAKT